MTVETVAVNGIDVDFTDITRETGKSAARRLAASFDRGGELEEATIRNIDAPVESRDPFRAHVWIKGRVVNFKAPDGWSISAVSVFDEAYACIKLKPE